MNLLSVNIRGLGRDDKAGWIKGIEDSEGASFIALRETQFRDLSDFNIAKYWGVSQFGSDYVEASGRSGGTLCLRDEGVFAHTGSVKHRYFLLIKGVNKGYNLVIKRRLWEIITGLKNNTPGLGLWVILGDFNSVRFEEERRNFVFNRLE